MKVKFEKSTARGHFIPPASKSYAHRALVLGAFSDGVTAIRRFPLGDDAEITKNALISLGVPVSTSGDTVFVTGKTLKELSSDVPRALFVGECATALRILIPLCLAIGGKTTFVGAKSLFSRPLSDYETLFSSRGVGFDLQSDRLALSGKLTPGDYEIPGNVSSQFATGLLLALPLLEGRSTLKVTGNIESAPYLSLTEDVLSAFGVPYVGTAPNYEIPGDVRPTAKEITLPTDFSSLSYFGALNYLGGDVRFDGVVDGKSAPDFVYSEYLQKIKDGFCTLDVKNCPDLSPLLMAMGAVFDGVRLIGTSRLKYKESDRGVVMAEELSKLGVDCRVLENEITVSGGAKAPNAPLEPHGDHRIAMALSVILTTLGGELHGAKCVKKSMPTFFDELQKLGVRLSIVN